MSEPLDPAPPSSEPFGDATDEAVSSLLDDELASFAEDHGVSEAEARARLTSWPGLEARSAELASARDALRGSSVAPLSDLERRRLVRQATEASASNDASTKDAGGHGRVLRSVLAVAAAIAVVVGFGAVLSNLDTGGNRASKSTAGGGSASAPAPLQGALGDVGDVTNPADLRALLDPSSESTKSNDAARTVNPEAPAANQSGSAADSAAGGFESAPPAAGASTADACTAQLAGARPVVLTATGTYRGAPAVIIGIQDKGRTILFVVPPGDCTNVLTSVSR